MFVIGNLLNAVAVILGFLLQSLMIVVFVNALLSWVRPDPSNPIVMMLDRISSLICDPIRKLFPTVMSGIVTSRALPRCSTPTEFFLKHPRDLSAVSTTTVRVNRSLLGSNQHG